MKDKVKIVLRYILAIAFGFGCGYFVKSELLVPSSDTDKTWMTEFTEDADHQRVIDFQNALQAPKDAKSRDELARQLDAQLRIPPQLGQSIRPRRPVTRRQRRVRSHQLGQPAPW